MSNPTLTQQVAGLRDSLKAIEEQLARSDTPPEGLEDFKSTVDSVRISVWAILSAARSRDYPAFSERFRLRRAVEVCRGLADEFGRGVIDERHPEATDLLAASRELATNLEQRLKH
jgi:phosphoglycolate phosphatase-like HAD superfamily hydrolase